MKPPVVFVLGMHRSGTSLATRILADMGLFVPGPVLSATDDNPDGYFEPEALVTFNNELLKQLGRPWYDDRPLISSSATDHAELAPFLKRARILLDGWQKCSKQLVLKDPRLCRTFFIWRQAAIDIGIQPRALLVIRRLDDVKRSLARRNENPQFRPAAVNQAERSELLWLQYLLDSEAQSRGLKRAVVTYDDLVSGHTGGLRQLTRSPIAIFGRLVRTKSNPPVQKTNASDDLSAVKSLSDLLYVDPCCLERNDKLATCISLAQQRFQKLRSAVPAAPELDPYASAVMKATQLQWASENSPIQWVHIISGAPLSKGHVYRVDHALEALSADGIVASSSDADTIPDTLPNGSGVVILYRLKWSNDVQQIVNLCRQQSTPIVFDIDDPVFEPDLMRPATFDYLRINSSQIEAWQNDAYLYKKTLEACDAAILTTSPLAELASKYSNTVKVVVNGIDRCRQLNDAIKVTHQKKIVGYASGTPTHQRDFAVAAGALAELLSSNASVTLCVVGHLDLTEFPSLMEHRDRIELRPAVSFDELHHEISRFDVNIAPLELDNPFCDCKSELKYFEAAAMGVPTIASATRPMRGAISHGVNGLLASNHAEWVSNLSMLIDQPEIRQKVGESAQAHATAIFGHQARATMFLGELYTLIREYRAAKSQLGNS